LHVVTHQENEVKAPARSASTKKKRVAAESSDEEYCAEQGGDASEEDPADDVEIVESEPTPARATAKSTPASRLGSFAARTPASSKQPAKRPEATPMAASQAKKAKPQGYV
jgi:hypothetical protein